MSHGTRKMSWIVKYYDIPMVLSDGKSLKSEFHSFELCAYGSRNRVFPKRILALRPRSKDHPQYVNMSLSLVDHGMVTVNILITGTTGG